MDDWKFDSVVQKAFSKLVLAAFYVGMALLGSAVLFHLIGASMQPLLDVLQNIPH